MNARSTLRIFALLILWAVAIVLFLFIAAAIAMFLYLESRASSRMLRHDQTYYLKIAESCQDLVLRTKISKESTIKGDDASLPAPLLKLRATKVRVYRQVPLIGSTNDLTEVDIIFGESRPDYIVCWKHTDYGNGHRPWKLVVETEGWGKTVYSTDDSSD